VKRALEETVKKLRKAGHEVIDWAPELHKEIINVLVCLSHGFTSKVLAEVSREPALLQMAVRQ